jgi:hypothetical protein
VLILAYFTYGIILAFMLGSAIWVFIDARKRGKPWSEAITWGLFCMAFIGLGLIVYKYWNRNINQ